MPLKLQLKGWEHGDSVGFTLPPVALGLITVCCQISICDDEGGGLASVAVIALSRDSTVKELKRRIVQAGGHGKSDVPCILMAPGNRILCCEDDMHMRDLLEHRGQKVLTLAARFEYRCGSGLEQGPMYNANNAVGPVCGPLYLY